MTTIKNILLRSEDFEINVFIDLGFEVEHDNFSFSASSLSFKNLAEASHSIEWRFNQRKNFIPPV